MKKTNQIDRTEPLLVTAIKVLMQHPFISTAIACFFCMTVTTSKVTVIGAAVPAVILCFFGIAGASAVSYKAAEKSRKSLMICLSVISVAFSALIGYMLKVSKEPQLVVLNVGIGVVIGIGAYLWSKKKLDVRRTVILIMILGFLMRLAFIATIAITAKQHDAGSIEKMKGHLGYIAYLVENSHLPDMDVRTVYQYYHPPLHHIIEAVWVKLQRAFSVPEADIWENIQIMTMFYSCCCMILSYKIFRALKLEGKGLIAAVAVIAFNPTFYILAGSVNNDILSVTLILGAVLNTIYWYESRSMGRILCIAACVGFGMMAKLSAWMVAPAIAFVFIFVFIKDLIKEKSSWKKYAGQFGAFIVLCAPIALWWEIRNYITHRVPFNYVMRISDKSPQYIGDISPLKRLFDFSPYQFENVGDQFTMYGGKYNEYNPLVGLFKTTCFDELFSKDHYKEISGLDAILFWTVVILGLVGFAAMIWCFFKDKKMCVAHKIFIGVLYATFFFSYYAFCLTFPHVCTENIRYAVPLIVIGAFFVGKALNILDDRSEKKEKLFTVPYILYLLLLTTIITYSAVSVITYDIIFVKG